MPSPARPPAERTHSEALLLRHAPFGEADAMVTFFTERRGTLSAVARSARRSRKRFPALEPMHLLRIGVEERPGSDVVVLVESALARPRLHLVADLARMEAAGRALRWVRRAAPSHTPEPALWVEVNRFLDLLDTPGVPPPEALLAGMGLRFLSAIGWGLDLTSCVRCGKACDPGSGAYLDPGEGGLVCRACGGARILLKGDRRTRILAAVQGDDGALEADDVRVALEIVEATLLAHS